MQQTLTTNEIDALLMQEQFGHLACCSEQKPYIVPLAYVYDGTALYGQTVRGKKLDIINKNPHVCFQVGQVSKTHWRSVLCWGTFEELDFHALDTEELKRITTLLSTKLSSLQHLVGVRTELDMEQGTPLSIDGKEATIFRIVIAEKTGRMNNPDYDEKG